MYDKYCHILDYNDPLRVICIIEEKIKNNTAEISDYSALYTLYIHVLQYKKAEEFKLEIIRKYPRLNNSNFFIIKNFQGDYTTLWQTFYDKPVKIVPHKFFRDVKDLLSFSNVKECKNLTNIENLFLFKQGGTGDEIIFFRWIEHIKPYVSGDIYYLSDHIINKTFLRISPYIKAISYNPKKNYSALSIFKLPHLLNIEHHISNKKYLWADPVLIFKYANKNKFRIGLCHHGQNISKLRGLLSIPRDKIVNEIGDRAEIVNLYYGEATYIKGQKVLLRREPRHPNITYLPLNNYEELLAIIETCDVVISCDTSVAHAAGAMGKKTYVLCNGRLYFPWYIEGHIGMSKFYEDVTVVKQFDPASWEKSVDVVVNQLISYK